MMLCTANEDEAGGGTGEEQFVGWTSLSCFGLEICDREFPAPEIQTVERRGVW
jgi:hypothetical protein